MEQKYQCKCWQQSFTRSINCSLHESSCYHRQELKRKGDSESFDQIAGSKKKVKLDINSLEIETAFDKAAVIYKIKADNINQTDIDIVNYIRNLIFACKLKIEDELQRKTSIKIYISCFIIVVIEHVIWIFESGR